MYSRHKCLTRHLIRTYFSPFCGLSLYFLVAVLWSRNMFASQEMQFYQFALSLVVLSGPYLRKHCPTKVMNWCAPTLFSSSFRSTPSTWSRSTESVFTGDVRVQFHSQLVGVSSRQGPTPSVYRVDTGDTPQRKWLPAIKRVLKHWKGLKSYRACWKLVTITYLENPPNIWRLSNIFLNKTQIKEIT